MLFPREAPPECPAGYAVLEGSDPHGTGSDDVRYFPVRLDGGYRPTSFFDNGGKPTSLLGHLDEETFGQSVEPFVRDEQWLCYTHEYPARYFLAKWVDHCGGLPPFEEWWNKRQAEKAARPFALLAHEYEQRQHVDLVLMQLFQEASAGELAPATLRMLLNHLKETALTTLQPFYAEALKKLEEGQLI